jgi:hypothetical protein
MLPWKLTYQCKQLSWSTVGKSSKQLGCRMIKVCKQLGWSVVTNLPVQTARLVHGKEVFKTAWLLKDKSLQTVRLVSGHVVTSADSSAGPL